MKKTFVRCLALAVVIGLSLGSLTYAKRRPGGSPLGASDTAAAREVNVETTNLERVVIPAADTRGATPPVMNVKAREKRMRVSLQRSENHIAMATLPVFGPSVKVPTVLSPPLQWKDCFCECMDCSWKDLLTLGACCLSAVTCPLCVAGYGTAAILCGHLCLVYS